MLEYFKIKEFDVYNKKEWDKFCLKSNDAWLWHTHDGIISKSLWFNHYNFSFSVIDKSNKNNIVAVFPLFLVKKKKLIDYSSFESLGGPALCNSLNKTKLTKLIAFINNYLTVLMKKKKVYKCELLLSSLSKSIIQNKKLIPNPLGPLISMDKSSFTWIKKIKNQSIGMIFNSFDNKTKSIIKKTQNLSFHELNHNDLDQIFKNYYSLHKSMSLRKKINIKNQKYFEYIFFKFSPLNKRIFYVKDKDSILSISIFGIYKKKAIYWTNVSDQIGLKQGSNYFCIWKALESLKKMRIEFIEFGEGFYNEQEINKRNLNHFKKSFGGEKYPLFRGEKIHSRSKDFAVNILKEIKNYLKKK